MRSLRRLGYRVASFVRGVYWRVARPRRTGALCVIVHRGRWLMVRHTYGDRRWTFPGGGVHRGEDAESAVRREVREEVGIELAAAQSFGSYATTRHGARDTVWCFVAEVASPEAVADGIEIAETTWVDPSALPTHGPAVDDVAALFAAR